MWHLRAAQERHFPVKSTKIPPAIPEVGGNPPDQQPSTNLIGWSVPTSSKAGWQVVLSFTQSNDNTTCRPDLELVGTDQPIRFVDGCWSGGFPPTYGIAGGIFVDFTGKCRSWAALRCHTRLNAIYFNFSNTFLWSTLTVLSEKCQIDAKNGFSASRPESSAEFKMANETPCICLWSSITNEILGPHQY